MEYSAVTSIFNIVLTSQHLSQEKEVQIMFNILFNKFFDWWNNFCETGQFIVSSLVGLAIIVPLSYLFETYIYEIPDIYGFIAFATLAIGFLTVYGFACLFRCIRKFFLRNL